MAHENKALLRHAKAIRCCYSTLGEDVPLSNRLMAVRVRTETDPQELADYLGFESADEYLFLENNPSSLTVGNLAKLAKFYDMSMSSLLFCTVLTKE